MNRIVNDVGELIADIAFVRQPSHLASREYEKEGKSSQ